MATPDGWLDLQALQVHLLIDQRLPGVDVGKHVGRKHLSEHKGAQRVVWVYTTSTYSTPRQAGSRMPDDGTAVRIPSVQQRSQGIDLHIFAPHVPAMEVLRDAVTASLFGYFSDAVEFTGDDWVTQHEGKAGDAIRNEYVILSIRVKQPVPEKVEGLTQITSTQHICEFFEVDEVVLPAD